MKRVLLAALAWLILAAPVAAQWQVPNYSVPIGRGTGTGFKSAAPGTAGYGLMSNGAAADPTFQGFLQSGTGAATRTWNSKAGDIVNVLDFGAGCAGGNDTTAIQNAIDSLPAGGGTVMLPRGLTCIVVGLDFRGKSNITFTGYGSVLRCNTGATAVACLDFRETAHNTVSGMTIYGGTAAGYTGFLVDAGTISGGGVSSYFKMLDVVIGPLLDASAKCLNLGSAVLAEVRGNNFSKCGPGITGGVNSTTVTIADNRFGNHTGPAILGCGSGWRIKDNAAVGDISGQAQFFDNNGQTCVTFTMSGNWLGDITAGSETFVKVTAEGAVIEGNLFAGNVTSPAIELIGGYGYSITGNNVYGSSIGLTCTSSPTSGVFSGNYMTFTSTPVSGTCVRFDFQNNNPSVSNYTAGQIGIGQTSADIAPTTVTGDVTINASGVTAIGTAKVTMAMRATQATNTVVGNATSGTASPTALAVPSCSTAASALNWTTNTGFGCNSSITAAAVPVGGISGLASGIASWLATSSSANLATALTDETGTGAAVFAGSPALTGTPTAPTAAPATNTTQIATTAFVLANAGATETGTWTPDLTFATPGDLAKTLSVQSGYYFKLGRLVTVTFYIQTSSFTHTTASGNLTMTGLPFTTQNVSNDRWRGTMQFSGITKAGYTNFTVGPAVNATTAVFVGSGSGVSASAVTAADVPSGGSVLLQGSVTYVSAS